MEEQRAKSNNVEQPPQNTVVPRDKGGRWLPGSGSPHPGGRKPSPLTAYLRRISDDGVLFINQIINLARQTDDPWVKLACWKEALDRTCGKIPLAAAEENGTPNIHLAVVNLISRLRSGESMAAIDTTIDPGVQGD